ncbi:MAG TPA: N-acetyltransferase [Bacteroidetes bacterium]|nr:N-acetyltransferase [Bacteroidota bacterium]|tara:strand:+ start:243 stop:827 length:585 start_codon:yes stop_codon:yes gene_type:complete
MIDKTKVFVHESVVIDYPTQIGQGSKVWHFSHIMRDVKIGLSCTIGQGCFIASKCVLGNNVKVQNNVSIYEGVICEDDVFLGPSMVFTNVVNPRAHIVRKDQYKKTIVRKGATVGANATIVCGIEIGSHSFVGAGSVVTKDIKPYELVYGNPARHKGWVSKSGHRLSLSKSGDEANCPESGELYRLTLKGVIIV